MSIQPSEISSSRTALDTLVWLIQDAFGSASMHGDQPPLVPANNARSRPPDELLAWRTEGGVSKSMG